MVKEVLHTSRVWFSIVHVHLHRIDKICKSYHLPMGIIKYCIIRLSSSSPSSECLFTLIRTFSMQLLKAKHVESKEKITSPPYPPNGSKKDYERFWEVKKRPLEERFVLINYYLWRSSPSPLPPYTIAQVRKEGRRKDSFDGLKVKADREGVLIPIDNSTALLDKLVWWSPRPFYIIPSTLMVEIH